MDVINPVALKPGSTLGVFTPSAPSYIANEGLFQNGLNNLEQLGFKIKLGKLTAQRHTEGYRSANGQRRAEEFMDLIRDPDVDGLISTIGGNNSSSLIPFLNFDEIRASRKIICGYSDVTSLHLAILKYAGLKTFYGPSVMCWFGEWPSGIPESSEWFLDATMRHRIGNRVVHTPKDWSNHFRRWDNEDWKNIPREWKPNEGWMVLNSGYSRVPIIAANLNTLVSAAGTPYWPDLTGKILLLEDMFAPMSRTERHLRQLHLMGVFDQLEGLIVGKPEVFQAEDCPFSYESLFKEIIGTRTYPIVTNFDCSHCVPMISIPQLAVVELNALDSDNVTFSFIDGSID